MGYNTSIGELWKELTSDWDYVTTFGLFTLVFSAITFIALTIAQRKHKSIKKRLWVPVAVGLLGALLLNLKYIIKNRPW